MRIRSGGSSECDASPGYAPQGSIVARRRAEGVCATLVAAAIALSIALTASTLGAQVPVDPAPPASVELVDPSVGPDDDAATIAPVVGAAPSTAVQPRSMRVYWHVFLSFGLAWLLILGYVASLGRRIAGLEREIVDLEGGSGVRRL